MISSYGCDHMTADAEFLLSKAKYKAFTGREQRRDADVRYFLWWTVQDSNQCFYFY